MSNGTNTKSSNSRILKQIQNLGPPLFYISLLLFYFSFFMITYFSPLLFPEYIKQLPFITEFKDFHDFYDHRYKTKKGHVVILIEFGIFIEIYFLLILSFYKTSTTNPGTIPDDDRFCINIPDNICHSLRAEVFASILNKREEHLQSSRNIITVSEKQSGKLSPIVFNERTSQGGARYCLTCMKFKPDRSHHCKYCNKCVLKMDHHCPWVGNCIGHNNYKFFVQMVFYAFLNCSFFAITYSDAIKFLIIYEKIISTKLIFFLSAYIFMLIIILFQILFLGFHLLITGSNYTTYEYITKVVRNKKNNCEENFDDTITESMFSRYNIGIVKNFSQVFGSNFLLWFLPISFESIFEFIQIKMNGTTG